MNKTLKQPCVEKVYYVEWKDVPLSCPTPAMSVWNAHPRVYLPIQETGREQCPYCGAIYVLAVEKSSDQPIHQPNVEIDFLRHRAADRAHQSGVSHQPV